jgi:hypothetical protein
MEFNFQLPTSLQPMIINCRLCRVIKYNYSYNYESPISLHQSKQAIVSQIEVRTTSKTHKGENKLIT